MPSPFKPPPHFVDMMSDYDGILVFNVSDRQATALRTSVHYRGGSCYVTDPQRRGRDGVDFVSTQKPIRDYYIVPKEYKNRDGA